MTECSRCNGASRRVIRPYFQLDARLCPPCCRYLAESFDTNNNWPPHPAQVAA